MRLSKVHPLAAAFFLTWAVPLVPSLAIERVGSAGVTFLAPIQLEPGFEVGDPTLSFDFGYFFDERWAADLAVDFGLTGEKIIDLAGGPKFYFRPDAKLNPYWTAKFLYTVSPKNDIGWRFNAGAEWNLSAWTGIDNLALLGELGVSQLFRDGAPNLLNLELIRLGLNWSW